MRPLLIAAALLASTAVADAGQLMFNGGAGPHYSRPFPNPGQRWLAPRGQYLQGYLAPSAIISGAIAGALSQLPPPPVRYYAVPPPPPPDAIESMPNPTTRAEVLSALERLCTIEPETPICTKLRQPAPAR